MHELVRRNRLEVIERLTERRAFERSSVELYNAVIPKVQASGDSQLQNLLAQLQNYRDHEREHEAWLAEQLRALGADARAITNSADLVTREPTSILDDFHALLTAELADNAGWDLLVELADEAGDRAARRAFKRRLHEEEEHLIFIRRALLRLARREILVTRSCACSSACARDRSDAPPPRATCGAALRSRRAS